MQDHAHFLVANFYWMSAISRAQHVVEGAGRVVLDLLHDPPYLKVSVLVVRIGDRQRDARLCLEVSIVVALFGVGQLDDLVFRVPQEPHWIDLRRAIGANGGEVGEQRPLEEIQMTVRRRHGVGKNDASQVLRTETSRRADWRATIRWQDQLQEVDEIVEAIRKPR